MTILSEIQKWAENLPAWQQHAVAVLYERPTPSAEDLEDILALLQDAHGIPDPVGRKTRKLTREQVAAPQAGQPLVQLTAIRNLQYVNALAPGKRLPLVNLLKAQMNTDLLTEDLKKARSSNQSFWLMGQPDVQLAELPDGRWQVEVNGFDYFDTVKGELISGGKTKIAMWSLDTDYDGRSLFPHQVFFPMAGKDEGWRKLKKNIRAELDESLLDQFHGTVSLPFDAGKHGKAAVKIVDDRGIESLKILPLKGTAA